MPDAAPSTPPLPEQRPIAVAVRRPPWAGRPAETVALWGILIIASLGLLYFAASVFLPLCLAVLLAVVLYPGVALLRRLGIPAVIGAAVVVVAFFGLIGIGIYTLAEPAAAWVDRWPVLSRQIEIKLGGLRESIAAAQEASKEIEAMAAGEGQPPRVVLEGPSLAEQLFAQAQLVVVNLAILLVLLYFLLARGAATVERTVSAIVDDHRRAQVSELVGRIQDDIGAYLRTITLINLALGVATAAVMALLGMPNPVLWGALAGLLHFLPYVGSLINLGVQSVVALLTFNAWIDVVAPPLAFLVLITIEAVVNPFILGRRLTLNPILVFVSILFWGWLWGVPGALLAVPILAVIKVVAERVEALAWARPVLA